MMLEELTAIDLPDYVELCISKEAISIDNPTKGKIYKVMVRDFACIPMINLRTVLVTEELCLHSIMTLKQLIDPLIKELLDVRT